jgi:hypothetical protein
MANRLMGGTLAERLEALRADDLSFETVARVLYTEGGVEATAETIRSWTRQLGIEPPVEAAS